jgi:hypothetical protein
VAVANRWLCGLLTVGCLLFEEGRQQGVEMLRGCFAHMAWPRGLHTRLAQAAPPADPCRYLAAGKSGGSKLKGEETAVVDQVSIIGSGKDKGIRQANIKLRFNRNPVIGERWPRACACVCE